MSEYFSTRKEEIFRHVSVMIYVVDVEKEGAKWDEEIN